jgi:hypothetical protein
MITMTSATQGRILGEDWVASHSRFGLAKQNKTIQYKTKQNPDIFFKVHPG